MTAPTPTTTLDLPADPAAWEQAVDLILQGLAARAPTAADGTPLVDRARVERQITRWCEAVGVGADTRAAALAHAGLTREPDPEATDEQATPPPSPIPEPAPPPPADRADDLAALAERVQRVEVAELERVPRWSPEREPLLAGTVIDDEQAQTRSGPVRVLTLRLASGELRAVWCGAQALADGLRRTRRQGRDVRPGDLLALHFRGTTSRGRKEIAVEATLR